MEGASLGGCTDTFGYVCTGHGSCVTGNGTFCVCDSGWDGQSDMLETGSCHMHRKAVRVLWTVQIVCVTETYVGRLALH